jgi:phosphoribosylformylglycinamidine synthase II
MLHTIRVSRRDSSTDAKARDTLSDIREFGLTGINRVENDRIYRLEGINREQAEDIAFGLLCDHVVDTWDLTEGFTITETNGADHTVEVTFNPGVTDPVQASVIKAARDMGLTDLSRVSTATRYRFYGNAEIAEVNAAAKALLVNDTVQHIVIGEESGATGHASQGDIPEIVSIRTVDDATLAEISRSRGLSLNVEEMRRIQEHFVSLDREPTDIELETLAQTWSEHCVHKTFKGKYEYDGKTIDNLMKHTIFKATKDLDRDWCVSVFADNAGIIKFDDENNVCFKVETHNHPSALEPYGGAGTGIGGVIRDILGVGLGGKPFANTDIFCFARPDYPADDVPEGVLHPRRIMRGVVSGVRDYGNRMGIPTVNGAVVFHDDYLGNPLVYCGTAGLIPIGMEFKIAEPGMAIVVVGGRTGRDGIHGATFSSAELGSDEENIWGNAVQIGNPITEKKVTDVLMVARDRGLYSAVTDCGAGGLSSAVGEMGEEVGAEVELNTVPLKYDGLTYTEVWISEAQERMVLAVAQEKVQELLDLFASEDVEATVIGSFTGDKRLKLTYGGEKVADIEMEFLHDGVPQVVREAVWTPREHEEFDIPEPDMLDESLKAILSDHSVASKEWVIRQYDHEVQGGSVIKPLVGVENDGPSDAAVTRPVLSSMKGVILSNGINPRLGLVDPYQMSLNVMDEALRQVVAVGGRRDKTALLDNFCWGNPEVPERLGEFVRAAQACYDGAMAYETPFISGKDSFYNEYAVDGGTISIPPTLLVSAMSVIDDVTNCISMDFKAPRHFIYVVGITTSEMGGSYYLKINDRLGSAVPAVNLETAPGMMDRLSRAIEMGLVKSCHDCSEGGVGVALAEMAFAGGFGASVDLGQVEMDELTGRSDIALFAETPTRWICEVAPDDVKRFEIALEGFVSSPIGQTTEADKLRVMGLSGRLVINSPLADLKEAWQGTLREV